MNVLLKRPVVAKKTVYGHGFVSENVGKLVSPMKFKNKYFLSHLNSCGEHDHLARDCPEGNTKTQCYNCKEMGHIARECPMEQNAVVAS